MKIYISILFLIILSISLIFYKNCIEKKNIITADNYIKAGLYLNVWKQRRVIKHFGEHHKKRK